MDDKDFLTFATLSILFSVVAAYAATGDGRTFRDSKQEILSLQNNQFERALELQLNGWFVKKIRCNLSSFYQIVKKNENIWATVHGSLPAPTARCNIQKRVAILMSYLAQGGQIDTHATLFGISKTRCVYYIH